MNTEAAIRMGIAYRGKPERVFDWNKAARIIRERRPHAAYAGLAEDLADTFSVIYVDGEPLEDGSGYLASTWATPQLYLDGDSVDCWIWEHETEWDADTRWPQSALDILSGGG